MRGIRRGIPLLVVVMNNEALGSEYYKLDVHDMKKELSTPDLSAVARAFGGRRTIARNPEEIRAASTTAKMSKSAVSPVTRHRHPSRARAS